jgi:hypothetical protein
MRDHAFAQISERLGGAGPLAQIPGRKRIFVARREAHALNTVAPGSFAQARSSVARLANLRPETLRAHSKS